MSRLSEGNQRRNIHREYIKLLKMIIPCRAHSEVAQRAIRKTYQTDDYYQFVK